MLKQPNREECMSEILQLSPVLPEDGITESHARELMQNVCIRKLRRTVRHLQKSQTVH